MIIDYTAKRSLVTTGTPHVVDTAYQIVIGVEVFDKAPRWTGTTNRSLAGNTVTVTHEYGDDISISTVPLDDSDPVLNLYNMREFLDSVRLGETFQINGQDAIISDPGSAYSETHIGYVYKQFSFSVRIL